MHCSVRDDVKDGAMGVCDVEMLLFFLSVILDKGLEVTAFSLEANAL